MPQQPCQLNDDSYGNVPSNHGDFDPADSVDLDEVLEFVSPEYESLSEVNVRDEWDWSVGWVLGRVREKFGTCHFNFDVRVALDCWREISGRSSVVKFALYVGGNPHQWHRMYTLATWKEILVAQGCKVFPCGGVWTAQDNQTGINYELRPVK